VVELKNDEREFSVLVNGVERGMADVFTDDPVWIRRLNKRFKAYKIVGGSYFYRVKTSNIIRTSFLSRGTEHLDGSEDE